MNIIIQKGKRLKNRMRKSILIGGGNIGKGKTEYETYEIDKEVVKLTNKKNPVFLFIGIASAHSDSYYKCIKKHYQNLGCTTTYLKKSNIINNPDIVKQKILSSDIIYIGGGDSIKLISEIKEYHIDKLLNEAHEKGCVLVGISAGAILLSKKGFSDSYINRGESNHYKFIAGLNLVNISICPHYNEEKIKNEELKEYLKHDNSIVYGIENNTAIKIIDNNATIIKSKQEKNVYECKFNKNYEEKIIKTSFSIK